MTQDQSAHDELARLRQLARLLDSAIPLPGGYRIGLDGIIGLIPGIGDAVTACAAAWIVVRAAQMGASTAMLVRMMWNIVLELVVGVVPILGDLFDFAWKANDRNIALLEEQVHRLDGGGTAGRRLTTATLLLLGAFLLLLGLLLVGVFWLLFNLLQASGAG